MRQFKLKSSAEFTAWKKTSRPKCIPANPRQHYGAEYKGLDDFLGFAKNYRPFAEARAFVWTLGLKGTDDWIAYTKRPEFPNDLPVSPSTAYQGQGWTGLGDFLGNIKEWNRLSIAAFLESLKPIIENLSESDLYLILARNGMLKRGSRLVASRMLRGLIRLKTPADIDAANEQIAEEFAKYRNSDSSEDLAEVNPLDDELLLDDAESAPLQGLTSLDDLMAIDQIIDRRITNDETIVEFMVRNRVGQLWQKLMDCRTDVESKSLVDSLRSKAGGEHFEEIRNRFLSEFDDAMGLPLPDCYDFRSQSGERIKPNAMQLPTTPLTQYIALIPKCNSANSAP